MRHSRPYVLLTGSTGMVGAQLLARLMRRHVPVIALVRGKGAQSAEARVDAVLSRFEDAWNQRLGRPAILTADMASPTLGLSALDERIIRDNCCTVLHCAASMSFRPAADSPNNEPFRTNVDGTAALLELSTSASIDTFHYVSTAYVCGVRSGVAKEDEIDIGQSFANDYERSKVRAEKLLHASKTLSSLTVYRPSIVIDSDGKSPFAQDRTIYGAFSLFKALTSKFGVEKSNWFQNLGFDGTERKNIVEAQWIADVIDGIFATPHLHGDTYHLTDSQGTSINEIEIAFHQAVSKSNNGATNGNGKPSRVMQLESNVAGNEKPMHSRSPTSELDLIHTISAPYVQTFLPYFKDDPIFDRSRLTRAMNELGIADQPHVGPDTIARVASVQLAQESPTALRKKNAAERSMPVDLGDRLLLQLMAVENESKLAASNCHYGASDWGIFITGPNGGDWRLDLNAMSASPAGQSCVQRLYCDRDTWNKLIQKQRSVTDAMSSGSLLSEFDEPQSNSSDRTTIHCVEQLISRLVEYANHEVLEPQRD